MGICKQHKRKDGSGVHNTTDKYFVTCPHCGDEIVVFGHTLKGRGKRCTCKVAVHHWDLITIINNQGGNKSLCSVAEMDER